MRSDLCSAVVLIVQIALAGLCTPTIAQKNASQKERLTTVLRRISSASGSGMIRPTLHIAESEGIAHFDAEDRSITIDPRLVKLADAFSNSGDKLLAYIIGHEYAHYVRGHDFSRKYHHTFGSILDMAGVRPGLVEILSASRKDEFEADYYGLYYAYIAGYRYTAVEVQKFMEAMKNEFQTGDISFTHPAWSQRKMVVDTVFIEFERLSQAYHSANVLMQCGRYKEAIQLYDWISSTVPFPDAQWNEFLARTLYVQTAMNKTIADPNVLLQRINRAPLLRDGFAEAPSRIELSDHLDKCESLVESLMARKYPQDLCTYASSLTNLQRVVLHCDACGGTALCSQHSALANELPKITSAPSSVAGAEQVPERQIRSKIHAAQKRFEVLRKSLPSSPIPVKDETIQITTNQEVSTSESRLTMSTVDGATLTVTIVTDECPGCTEQAPVTYGDAIWYTTEGLRVYAVVTREDSR